MFTFHADPSEFAGVGLCFTDRTGGHSTGEITGFNLGRTHQDSLPALRANIADLRTATGLNSIAFVHQVHGVEVYDVDADSQWCGDRWLGDRIPGAAPIPIADALITTKPGIGLAIRVADCVPVLFADAKNRVIAAAHAGRRGLLAGILPLTIEAMRAKGAQQITAWIGPHICGECYEVPVEMAAEAAAIIPGITSTTSWGTAALDLGVGAQLQLEAAGVTVFREDPCTLSCENLYSHRGDGDSAGRQIGLIWLS